MLISYRCVYSQDRSFMKQFRQKFDYGMRVAMDNVWLFGQQGSVESKEWNRVATAYLAIKSNDIHSLINRCNQPLIDDIVDNSVETDDIEDSFLINDGDEDDDFSYEEEEAYDEFDGIDDDEI